MTALSANAEIIEKKGDVVNAPVVASDIIYKGSLCKFNAAGYLAPCSTESGAYFAGIAEEKVDNSSGSAGDKYCNVKTNGVFLLTGSSFAQSDLGTLVYASDDATITKTDSGNLQPVGRIVRYLSATQVWVSILGSNSDLGSAVEVSEVTLAEGNVLLGNGSGVGSALDASGDAKILVGNGTTITSVAVSGDVTIDNAGAVTLNADLAEGNVFLGNGSGKAAALDASGDAKILVGNGTTITSVAVSGDVTISNSGAVTIASGAIDKAMLSAGIKASHMVVYAGEFTTLGGDANESIGQAGIVDTDIVVVTLLTVGSTPRTITTAAATTDAISVVMSGDPSTDHVLSYVVYRATS